MHIHYLLCMYIIYIYMLCVCIYRHLTDSRPSLSLPRAEIPSKRDAAAFEGGFRRPSTETAAEETENGRQAEPKQASGGRQGEKEKGEGAEEGPGAARPVG